MRVQFNRIDEFLKEAKIAKEKHESDGIVRICWHRINLRPIPWIQAIELVAAFLGPCGYLVELVVPTGTLTMDAPSTPEDAERESKRQAMYQQLYEGLMEHGFDVRDGRFVEKD